LQKQFDSIVARRLCRVFEERRNRNPEPVCDGLETAGTDPVFPGFVFLDLLEANAQSIGKL